MSRHKDPTTWLLLGAAAVGVYYYLKSSGSLPAAMTPATPLSIYPEYAGQTSMAASPNQQAPAAVIIPTPGYTAVQGQEQAAVLTQCAGSYPGCTILMSDTQLGL